MSGSTDYTAEIDSRIRDCDLQRSAFDIRLSKLQPANLLLVVGAGLLSLFAGASILTDSRIITSQAAGVMALISAALTLIHNLLHCDPHQAECRRLRGLYEELRIKYRSLKVLTDSTAIQEKLVALDAEQATIAAGATAVPPPRCVAQAQRDLERNRLR